MTRDEITLGRWLLKRLAVILLIVSTALLFFLNSEWYKKQVAEDAAQNANDAVPRVIREIDGCKVYAFKATYWHYFTRCQSTTSTDASREVQYGKTTRTEIETITTANK